MPNDLKKLDLLFDKIMKCFIAVSNNIKNNNDLIKKDKINFLYEFCLEKKNIKKDLLILSSLLPKLGKISSKPFILN